METPVITAAHRTSPTATAHIRLSRYHFLSKNSTTASSPISATPPVAKVDTIVAARMPLTAQSCHGFFHSTS